MRTGKSSQLLKAAVIAGVIAGLVMGIFHYLVTEPYIDQAINLEEKAKMAPGQTSVYEPELVSRSLQKPMVIVGGALYGLLVGTIFAGVFAIAGRRLPGRWPDVSAGALAGLLWWSVGLLPFLKYPANPPGVGDPATIYSRQASLLGFIVLSALAPAAAAAVWWLLGRRPRGSRLQRWRPGIAMGFYAVSVILLFSLMPANPDPVTAPASLVWDFRIRSMGGEALFWATLGGVFPQVLRRLSGGAGSTAKEGLEHSLV